MNHESIESDEYRARLAVSIRTISLIRGWTLTMNVAGE